MTRRETIKLLNELDEYFRIHGWCTQTSQKISSLVDGMTEKDQKYVREWAYETLEQVNITSTTQILAIILLKLLGVTDKELIRLLYTVLSGRLTYEDFNSLNLYIFEGKPPLSKDLFYNITERVFLNKKTALLKALSVTTIITEADPELTIFYLTMLLCRVDLNNENRAMLNLLLYCIDADIPDEVSKGVRGYLLSIKDVLEEIFTSDNNPEVQKVIEKVIIQMERETRDHGFIPIESKHEEKEIIVQDPPPVHNMQRQGENNKKFMSMEDARLTETENEKSGAAEYKPSGSTSDTLLQDLGKTGEKINSGENTPKSPPTKENQPIKAEDRLKPIKGSTLTPKKDRNSRKKAEKKQKKTRKQERDQNGESRQDSLPGENNDIQISAESPVETEPPVETGHETHYELKLKKFRLSELLSGERSVNKAAESTETIARYNDRKRHYGKIAFWAAIPAVGVLIGWSILSTTSNPSPPAPVPAPVVSVVKKAVSADIKPKSNDSPALTEVPSDWKLRETDRGIEWTVKKGESVWKLHEYLSSHTSELSEPLRSAGKMDWIPFIKKIRALNPSKNFEDFIEPGEVFLILQKKK